MLAENNASLGFISGRLTRQRLAAIPDIAARIVMTCGPAPYMAQVESMVKSLGVKHLLKEVFFAPTVTAAATHGMKIIRLHPPREFFTATGSTLLEAMESNLLPVNTACRAGVCGCCKTKIFSGDYQVTSTMTLSEQEIAQGNVLACSCYPQSDLVLA